MGLFSFLSGNKKGPTYSYKNPELKARAARNLVSNLNAGKVSLGYGTHEPGAKVMLPDENGLLVVVEYVGIVDGKAKWKKPDKSTGTFTGQTKGTGMGTNVGFGMGMGGPQVATQEPIDVPLNDGTKHGPRTMGGGGQLSHSAPTPVFGGGMGMGGAPGSVHGGGFGMGSATGQNRYQRSTRPSHHALLSPRSGSNRGPVDPRAPGYYQQANHPTNGMDPYMSDRPLYPLTPFPLTPQQYSQLQIQQPTHKSQPAQRKSQRPTQYSQSPQRQQQQSQGERVLPPGVVDPLATVQEPLGKHGKRAYVPGQTQLQQKFRGDMTDPEQRYKYLAELEKLRKENERKGGR